MLSAYSMDVVKIIILWVLASECNMNVNSIFKMIAEHCYHITSNTTAIIVMFYLIACRFILVHFILDFLVSFPMICVKRILIAIPPIPHSTVISISGTFVVNTTSCGVASLCWDVMAANGMMKSKRLSSVSVINVNILTKICKHQE